MTVPPSLSVRMWRHAPWHRSPLLRRRDRLESAVALVVAVFVVMTVPFAAAYGTVTYGSLVEQARLDTQTHRQVEALVLDTAPTDAAAPGTGRPLAPATDRTDGRWVQWSVDGHAHTGRSRRAADARPGETLALWVDSRGVPAEAPRSGTDSATTAVLTALTVWAVVLAGGVGIWYGMRPYSEHRRLQEWDREWSRADDTPGWPVG